MTTAYKGRFLLYCLVMAVVLSCAACVPRLPDYARPHLTLLQAGTTAGKTSFGHRRLTIADFQADSLPEKDTRYSRHIQARSCIGIVPVKNTGLRIHRGSVANRTVYVGRFTDIAFQAVFDPQCSWWNPRVSQKRKSYVLQHEQIHFDLAELGARRLNRLYSSKLQKYLAFGNSPREVRAQLAGEAQRFLRKGVDKQMQTHTDFDEQTSLYFDPQAQQVWFERVRRELHQESQWSSSRQEKRAKEKRPDSLSPSAAPGTPRVTTPDIRQR